MFIIKRKRFISILLITLLLFACANPGEPEITAIPEQYSITTPVVPTEADWRRFLVEYEEWVDSYIAFLTKDHPDPFDPAVMEEYEGFVEESNYWTDREGWIQTSLSEEPAQLQEYLQEIERILNKFQKLLTNP